MKLQELVNENGSAIKLLKNNYLILIDSGHGWETSGKRSQDGELRENEFNVAVEDKLCLLLDLLDIEYKMLAPEFKDIPLPVRVVRENAYFGEGTRNNKRVLGISIHANATDDENLDKDNNTDANGIETFHHVSSRLGKELATAIHSAILRNNIKEKTITKDRGVKANKTFYILRRTLAIWVLIEAGFMTNAKDREHLNSDGYRNDIAMSILEGLIDYVE